MSKFNFASQICTTKEQSERLLALGLKKETADCCWIYSFGAETWILFSDSYNYLKENDFMREEKWYIPAWSLHRLIEMYSEHYVCEHINLKLLTYDTIIENIRLDILSGTFNKDYLKE